MGKDAVLSMKRISISLSGSPRSGQGGLYVKKRGVHALTGENGAGKSTLIKVLAGVYSMDEGEIYLESHDGPLPSDRSARRRGWG